MNMNTNRSQNSENRVKTRSGVIDFDNGRPIGFGCVAECHAAWVMLKNALSNVG